MEISANLYRTGSGTFHGRWWNASSGCQSGTTPCTGTGTWLSLKDDLRLGSGPFSDELTTLELEELDETLAERIVDQQ